jgi:hypothetical protein
MLAGRGHGDGMRGMLAGRGRMLAGVGRDAGRAVTRVARFGCSLRCRITLNRAYRVYTGL